MDRCAAVLGCLALAACANRAGQSVALYEKGDYAGAARAADTELAAHPGDEGLWQMRVRAALAQGDAAGVAKAYGAYRGQLGDDDKELLRDLAIATLGQALASPSVKLKVTAIEAVEAAELEPLAELVAQRMGDDDDRVVAAAAVAVLRGHPLAPDVAGDMLRSEDSEARRIAVEGIGKKVGKLAFADLENAATDPEAKVRRAAIRWLGQLKDDGAVELLTRHLRDPDDAVRAASGVALARIGVGNLEELGKRAVADRALGVRLAGIELLVAARRPEALAALSALADDRDPIVAIEAAIARGGGEAAARALERAAASDEWTARAGAANLAVRAVGKPAAIALARRLAGDREGAVRLAAARVLAHAGDTLIATGVFVAALGEPDHALQAATDLAEQNDERGIKALDAAVQDPARGPLERAAAATAHRSARRITPGLVAALADDSGVVRVEAAAALALLSRR
jgi:HEAT repeat protein